MLTKVKNWLPLIFRNVRKFKRIKIKKIKMKQKIIKSLQVFKSKIKI